jgi:HAD superfamily hydrolase (TIGR01509 family)
MSYAAVIFDLDGTLVDTITLWTRAYVDSLEDIGVSMSDEDFIENLYTKASHVHTVLEGIGKLETVDAFRTSRDARYIRALETSAVWIAGAEEVLTELKGRTRIAIATGSHRSYTDPLDAKLGLSRYAEMIITCDDVEQGKPEPDMLLLAAERLHLQPSECLYVGDQMFDVAAAHSAGMPCWVVPNANTPNEAKQKADTVIHSLAELLTLL